MPLGIAQASIPARDHHAGHAQRRFAFDPAMLIGRDALVRKLALVDLRSSHAGLLETIAGFDGALNLLPHVGTSISPIAPSGNGCSSSTRSRPAVCSDLCRIVEVGRLPLVAVARCLDSSEGGGADPRQPARPDACFVRGRRSGRNRLRSRDRSKPRPRAGGQGDRHRRGDGRVLWETGIPKGITTFYMNTSHGDLANDRRYFPRFSICRRERRPNFPSYRRCGVRSKRVRDARPAATMVPDEAELISDAMGGRRVEDETRTPEARIAIRVVHDNLTNARSPVLASHYHRDVIVAAEAYLDAA